MSYSMQRFSSIQFTEIQAANPSRNYTWNIGFK